MLRGVVNPVVTVLDCSKAFDKCKFSLLFTRLLDKGIRPVVIRVIAYIYMEQYGWVKWGDSKSRQMNISNSPMVLGKEPFYHQFSGQCMQILCYSVFGIFAWELMWQVCFWEQCAMLMMYCSLPQQGLPCREC